MNRLFLRLFAWFLAANLATVAATILIAKPALQALQEDQSAAIAELATEAVRRFESGGPRALGQLLHETARERRIAVALIRPDGRPASPVPLPLRRHLPPRERRPGKPPPPPSGEAADHRRLVEYAVSGEAGPYRLVALLPGPDRRALQALGPVRIGVTVAVLAVLALLFSQALARPLNRLSSVSRRMAAGDLSARASAQIGPRRDEIGDLAREFDRMAERIEALVGSQQQLLRDISHELRSPLARLEVALELARERGGPASELDRIGLEAARLAELIDQILRFARLQAAPQISREAVDLAQLVDEVCADAGYAAGEEAPDIRLEAPPSVPIQGDAELLRSAIDNLLRNAQKYGSGAIEVSLSAEPSRIRLAVRDHGPGVDPGALEQIFQPFVRTSSARERSSGGHGIGLAIVAQAARHHGGTVSARNAQGGGLVVEIVLPRATG